MSNTGDIKDMSVQRFPTSVKYQCYCFSLKNISMDFKMIRTFQRQPKNSIHILNVSSLFAP